MDNITKTTHPLILVAAVSVTIASLAAAAHFTGLLPTRSGETPAVPAAPAAAVTAPAPATTPTPAPVAAQPAPAPLAQAEAQVRETPRPAAKPRVQHHASATGAPDRRSDDSYSTNTHRVSTNNAGIDVIPSGQAPAVNPAPAPAPAAAVTPPVCHECGTVESVREITVKGEGSPVGAIAGGVLGGLLGHQVGRGSGKDLATIAGAVGGAFAGHEVEKNVRTNKQYQVEVRFDDGAVRSYTLANATWRNGDRVRLANGGLVPIGYSDR